MGSRRKCRRGRNNEGLRKAVVSLQVHFDAKNMREVIDECSATAIQAFVVRECLGRGKVHVRVVEGKLCLWVFLRHCHYSEQQNRSESKKFCQSHCCSPFLSSVRKGSLGHLPLFSDIYEDIDVRPPSRETKAQETRERFTPCKMNI